MNEHAPGWYDHQGERRYWDGVQWTHATSVPPPAPYGQLPAAARKEPALSVLVSFVVPGVGQMVNGDVGTGVAFLSAYIGGMVLVLCLGWILIGFIGLPIAIGAWIWSMIDAYYGAVRYNQRLGYPG